MSLRGKWLVLWSLWAARLVRQPTVPLRVSNGLLSGAIANDGSHTQYFGIPYASTNAENRFKAPHPEPKWDGIFEAYNEHIRCTQRFSSNKVSGEENCLTLNVYTPTVKDDPLPVMVFIHGGGFRDGSGSPFIYGPEYLVKHGIILVTFNYRLEILGFLCLGTKNAPGNVGLKDQVAALRWVKRNIKAFGGDPNNITIFGESAGSASIMYHLVSPMSTGLFHKAIMQSGSAMSPWSLQFEPLKIASKLAKQAGYNTENTEKLYKIFRNMPAKELLKIRVPRTDGDIVLSENIFVPCVEKKIAGEEQFLTDTPYNLIAKGKYNKVPIIIGYNSAEGFMFAGKENDTTISKLDFYKALPRDLIFSSEEDKTETAKKLNKLYMGDKTISKKTIVEFSKYEGDSGIIFPVISTIDMLIKTMDKSIYAYRIDYDGWLNLAKMYFGFGSQPGTAHADELFYMFKLKATLPFTYIEMRFINKITTMWTNFAKFGNPTPIITSELPTKWEPTEKKYPRVLEIGEECFMKPLWSDDAILFWNNTYTKFRRKN